MAEPKRIHWALFDDKWNYRGGVLTLEGETPTSSGDNKHKHKEVQVDRFPQHYETWDQESGSWKQDIQLKHKVDRRTEMVEGRRTKELDLPSGQTQRWFYLLLKRLLPDTPITPEIMDEFFPFVDQEEPPKSLKRPKKHRGLP